MRDTVDPDFASYVDARQGRWLRTAYLVYGDPERAEEQLLHAFTRLSMRWGSLDDPDLFVQRLLYRGALSRWFRATRSPPVEEDDDPVRVTLTGMSAVDRTVLVLLYQEELTEFEVAEVLGMSHAAVHGHAQTAVARFRAGLGHGGWRDVGERQ